MADQNVDGVAKDLRKVNLEERISNQQSEEEERGGAGTAPGTSNQQYEMEHDDAPIVPERSNQQIEKDQARAAVPVAESSNQEELTAKQQMVEKFGPLLMQHTTDEIQMWMRQLQAFVPDTDEEKLPSHANETKIASSRPGKRERRFASTPYGWRGRGSSWRNGRGGRGGRGRGRGGVAPP